MKQIKAGSLFRYYAELAIVVAEDGEGVWECQVISNGGKIFLYKSDILDALI